MDNPEIGVYSPNSPEYLGAASEYVAQTMLEKAYTTGSGIVQPGETTAAALRPQFLSDTLEQVSFSQDDAGFMKDIAKEKIGSVTAEWSASVSYGGAGDGFVPETGSDGMFNVSGVDDLFSRQIQNVKYMANYRQVSRVAQVVKSVTDPRAAAQKYATLELISKINLALYYGNEKRNVLQFNGINSQIIGWVDAFPGDSAILFDAGGKPLTKELFLDIITQCAGTFYGKPTELRCSVNTYKDVQKQLFPEARYTEGNGTGGAYGTDRNRYLTGYGDIKLKYDKMLRANRPLVANGPGADGKPRFGGTVDPASSGFAATPFVAPASAIGVQALAAGTSGNFWQNGNSNADTGPLASVPPIPTGQGNQGNRLTAASYLYAVSSVTNGRESAAWVYGAAASGTTTGATAVVVTGSNNIVQLELDPTQITPVSGVLSRKQTFFRVYRAPATATTFSQFDFLETVGIPIAGNTRLYDNGYRIPGADTAFLLTPENNGSKQVFLGQLLPLMKTELPLNALSNQMALLFFGTPIVRVGRFQVIIRNIGAAVNP